MVIGKVPEELYVCSQVSGGQVGDPETEGDILEHVSDGHQSPKRGPTTRTFNGWWYMSDRYVSPWGVRNVRVTHG